MPMIPNAGKVAKTATSMYAAYGAILIYALEKGQEYLQSPEGMKFTWTNSVLGVLLVVIPIARLWYQRSLATKTEQKLLEERITRQRLEAVATSDGPPISKDQVKSIKKDAAVEAAGVDP